MMDELPISNGFLIQPRFSRYDEGTACRMGTPARPLFDSGIPNIAAPGFRHGLVRANSLWINGFGVVHEWLCDA